MAVSAPHYAHQVFPWANIDKGFTLDGFITHRHGWQRQAWGRVLAGSDEELAQALGQIAAPALVNFGLTGEVTAAFVRDEIKAGRIDDLLSVLTSAFRPSAPLIVRAVAFRAGWYAARAAWFSSGGV